jgi:hypothetical protein
MTWTKKGIADNRPIKHFNALLFPAKQRKNRKAWILTSELFHFKK